jgi:hypothetical protein
VSALAASGLGIAALVNIAWTLEFIGAAGILLTIINKVSSYNSVDVRPRSPVLPPNIF